MKKSRKEGLMAQDAPFTASDVLYRFTPTEKERKLSPLFADEYVVEGAVLRIWGKYDEEWEEVSTWQWAIVMRRLLADLDALRASVGWQPWRPTLRGKQIRKGK